MDHDDPMVKAFSLVLGLTDKLANGLILSEAAKNDDKTFAFIKLLNEYDIQGLRLVEFLNKMKSILTEDKSDG